MSKTSYSSSWKNCATCAFWTGLRQVSSFRDKAEVDTSTKGKCAGGGWNNSERVATASACSKWQKWPVLK